MLYGRWSGPCYCSSRLILPVATRIMLVFNSWYQQDTYTLCRELPSHVWSFDRKCLIQLLKATAEQALCSNLVKMWCLLEHRPRWRPHHLTWALLNFTLVLWWTLSVLIWESYECDFASSQWTLSSRPISELTLFLDSPLFPWGLVTEEMFPFEVSLVISFTRNVAKHTGKLINMRGYNNSPPSKYTTLRFLVFSFFLFQVLQMLLHFHIVSQTS